MKLYMVRTDFGKSGRTQMDEIINDAIGLDDSVTAEEIAMSECEVEGNGLTYHFLPYPPGGLCVHSIAVEQLREEWNGSDLLKLNVPESEKAKLQPPFDRGDWYGIRLNTFVTLHPSSKVSYFEGPGVNQKVIREVESFVIESSHFEGLSLLRIESHGSDYFATDRFQKAYNNAKLTGLRFIDTNCKFV